MTEEQLAWMYPELYDYEFEEENMTIVTLETNESE